METRNTTQIKVWGLILNTMGSAESGSLVALASNEQTLKDFYQEQLLPAPERIDRWIYSFREGPLRSYNPSGTQPVNEDIYGHGIFSQWVNEDEIRDDVYKVDF